MEKNNKEPYIKQQAEGENLYTHLQKQMLEEVQRLSGKVWTDFNPHDPGVTLADIACYALTEMDYKLGFRLMDYLMEDGKTFIPERFGLFSPGKVYTTAPITTEDYRRLFFSRIPELENVWMECDTMTGGYTIKAILSPFENDHKDVAKQIATVYNSRRNLCEYLDKVVIMQPEELEFQAEFEIKPGEDVTLVLAKVYWAILHYLSGAVRISTSDELVASGMSPEEWLEGLDDTVRVVIPKQQYTEYELYKELCLVEGISSFSTCYLMKGGKPLTDFSKGFSLKIPRKEEELMVRIRCGCSLLQADMEKFMERLKAFYYTSGRLRTKKAELKEYEWDNTQETYRDIFTHTSIVDDFPPCYNFPPDGEISTSFKAYLQLYDQTIQQGLKEVEDLPRLLSIKTEDIDYPSVQNLYTLKSRYLDFLDRLFNVDSQPVWMNEFDSYGETTEDILRRRTGFLRQVAYLTKNRAVARDIGNTNEKENIAVAKKWFCLLLGISYNESRSVGNVLPGHNLVLMNTGEKGKRFRDRLTAMLINERMLDSNYVETITPEKLPEEDKEKKKLYDKLRIELPVFNHNLISSSLFRGGILLDNYRIVEAAENEYMLVFRNREENNWMNLGRTDDKIKLNMLANVLHHYLLELNHDCETLYIVEPVLSDTSRPFTLSLVLPSWTARFHAPRFREVCRELLRSLLPAHLKGTIYWLDGSLMQEFEDSYRLWRKALARHYMDDVEILQESMDDVLNKTKEKQLLDDTY